jgi:cyanophycinase-like exopeptidase
VDEVTALLVEPDGSARVVGNGTAYMCELSHDSLVSMTCRPETPLTVLGVKCERLQASGFFFKEYNDPHSDTFDFNDWSGSGVKYSFDIQQGLVVGNPYGPIE